MTPLWNSVAVVAPTLLYTLSVLYVIQSPEHTLKWGGVLWGTTVGVIIVCMLLLLYVTVLATAEAVGSDGQKICGCECMCFAQSTDREPSEVACVVNTKDSSECKTQCQRICRGNHQYRVVQP